MNPAIQPIILAAKEYQRTGIMPKELYVCFDQNGIWFDSSLWESEEKELRNSINTESLWRLKNERIDPKLLLETIKPKPNEIRGVNKIRLLSSLNIDNTYQTEAEDAKGKGNILTNLAEVMGSICTCNQKVEFPNLRHVGRQLSISGDSSEAPFPQLQEIGQCLVSGHIKTLKLPKLERIGALAQLDHVETLEAPRLREIGKGLYAPNITELNLPNLELLGGQAMIRKTRRFNAPKLQEISGHLWLGETKDFTLVGLQRVQSIELKGGTAFFPALEKIQENLKILGNQSLPKSSFPKLNEIGGELLLGYCPKAEFPQLKKIGGKLTALRAKTLTFPKLKELGTGFREMGSNLFGSSQQAIAHILKKLENRKLEKILGSQETGYLHDVCEKELQKRKVIKEVLDKTLALTP